MDSWSCNIIRELETPNWTEKAHKSLEKNNALMSLTFLPEK